MEIILGIIFLIIVGYQVTKKRATKTLQDPEQFKAYVRERNYSVDEQKDLCKRLGIDFAKVSKSEEAKNPRASKSKFTKKDFDSELVTVWTGNTKDIEFTYEKFNSGKERRTVTPTEVCFNKDGLFYIKGICHKSNELRTFKQDRITTKIKVGSKRYEFDEWCEEALAVDVWSVCPDAAIA